MVEKESSAENFEDEKKDRMKKLVELFEAGMDSKECIGCHGTSMESVEFLIEHGHLPGGKFEHIGSEERWIYFFPEESHFPDVPKEKKFRKIDALKEAAGYADAIAKSHFLLKTLGLDIENEEFECVARGLATDNPNDINDPDAEYNFFIKMGIDKKQLKKTVKEARKRKGVVLGFSEKLLEGHLVMPGDSGENDLRISVPEGLKFEYLSGLEPMGDEEWEYFEKLQEENKE